MSFEVSDAVVDLAPADDVVIVIDPIELEPIAVDLPEDAQTFGGTVDILVDPQPTDPVPTDIAPIDDGIIYTTMVIDDTAPVDAKPDDTAADGSAGGDATSEDGPIFTTTVIDDVPTETGTTEPGATDGGDVIGRPVDPEPNWRTLDGPADGGSTPDDAGSADDTAPGTDEIGIIACDGYPVYKGEDGDSAVPTDVIYTLDPADPLIYATSTGVVDGPVRSSDPLPYERGAHASVTVTVPESDPEIDRTPVHYAASESFHTGLDLL